MHRASAAVTIRPSTHTSGLDHSIDLSTSNDTYQHQQQQQHRRPISQRKASVDVSRPVQPADNTTAASAEATHAEPAPFKPTRGLWFILMSIAMMSLAGSVEGTIVVNALPTITAALGGGNSYIWVPNAFYLASIAGLPLYAQLSDIFGRRSMMLGTVLLYILGCALGGASKSMTMLIVARTIQGFGSGGIDCLLETIVIDLVPLRERGKYMSFVSIGTTVGFAVGPFLGGLIVVRLGWPWIFYLCAIFSSASFVMFFFFLRLKHRQDQGFWAKVKRIDFGGNAIFIGAVVAVLLALTWAGPVYHWNSAQIIVPLVLGLLGLFAFVAFEWTPRLAPEPSFPRVIVSNRTSSAALGMTLIQGLTSTGVFYFLPVYFQGVLVKSPLGSGIALAPIAASIIPFAMVSGILMSKVGKYRPFHLVAWSAVLLSTGLYSYLGRHSSAAAWACFELIGAAGVGTLAMTLLPAMQAPLSERQAATSAGAYTFAKGFGSIWGITIPSVVFNDVVKRQVMTNVSAFATNPTLAISLADGQAYQLATKAFLDSLPASDSMLREQLIAIFEHALHVVFYVLMGFSALGLLLVFVEKEVSMRRENNTEFGLDEGETRSTEACVVDGDAGVGHSMTAAVMDQHDNAGNAKSRAADIIELEDMGGLSSLNR